MKLSLSDTEKLYNTAFENEIEAFKDQFQIKDLNEDDIIVEFYDSSDGIEISLILTNPTEYLETRGLYFDHNGQYIITGYMEPKETEGWVRENVLQ